MKVESMAVYKDAKGKLTTRGLRRFRRELRRKHKALYLSNKNALISIRPVGVPITGVTHKQVVEAMETGTFVVPAAPRKIYFTGTLTNDAKPPPNVA
ncbi:hypothetical protein J7438_07170 [Thalassotalea sp. G20_0]|uniref:hypothetical protein n=1 Tax=Thalassotalea sp. G20_0 TaxID=2821093 RepID=UPI001ADBFBEC|nr:hypothetical protein [Thalassotalea sp. G20_0]MBO9493866.1 hypothetical protein [Thalassotalea sp. G20_0]